MKTKIILFLIVLSALFLRVYQLDKYPAGLNADEAAIGYNAYSLIKTGKDEFGHPWPINFQSFNDFKPGLYFYLVLPMVKAFGLNEWAVRLPSAILGTLTVLILYYLVRQLTLIKTPNSAEAFSLIASLLLAVSPWHIHFSRGGWETNAATFFIVLGAYLFFRALKFPLYFVLCTLSFIFSMFTYHSARVIVPFLVLGLLFFYRQEIFLKKNLKAIIGTVLVGGFFSLILLISMIGPAGVSRFSGVGIFADLGPLWRSNELRGEHLNPNGLFPRLIHNQYLEYGLRLIDNYLRHFSGEFLFVSGDEIQRNRVPGMGQFYLCLFPFLLFGVYFLLRNKSKAISFIFWWILVAPLASAMTFQSPHAIRALNLVIPLTIVVAYGIFNVWQSAKEKRKIIVILLSCYLAILLPVNFIYYLHQYYIQYPKVYPSAWEDGFKELISYVKTKNGPYDKIFVTNKYDQPYILFAFYLKYPPGKFQTEAKLTPRDQYGFSTVAHFDNYYFGPITKEILETKGRVLIIGTTEEIPDSGTIANRIYFKDSQSEAFRVIEKQ
ncbi:MAG: glycosyltransferase family 39 protein [Patescibacteria group bacterium]|nr:glycosyltransferase family 39 protein [Patescibacteria group bacterium]